MYGYDDSRKRFRDPREDERWNSYHPTPENFYPPPQQYDRRADYDDRDRGPNAWQHHENQNAAAAGGGGGGGGGAGAGSRATVRCYIHDKVRTLPNMYEEEAGRFRCRENTPCRTPANAVKNPEPAPGSSHGGSSQRGQTTGIVTKCVCVSVSYVVGQGNQREGPVKEVGPRKNVYSMAVMLVNDGDEAMLFEGRVRLPRGTTVAAEECARVGVDEPALHEGASLDTVKTIVSAFTRRGCPLVSHDVRFFLDAMGIGKLPPSLFYDVGLKFKPQESEGADPAGGGAELASLDDIAARVLQGQAIHGEGDRCRAVLALHRAPM